MVPSCGAAVCSWTIEKVKSVDVFSSIGVVVMGTTGVTILHPRGLGKLELTPPPKVASPSLKDSLTVVCRDGDPLRTIPMNTAPASFPSGERLWLPMWSVVILRLPEQMLPPKVSLMPVRLLPLVTKVAFDE
jgi:hypothetical protein